MTKRSILRLSALTCLALSTSVLHLAGCATESHRTLTPETVEAHGTAYNGPRYKMSVGRFQNRTDYMKGLFTEGSDRLGNQAKTILKTHLQDTGRFTVMDRENMNAIEEEARLSGATQELTGAQVAITGDVTEFGRKTTGDVQLFGILGVGKTQTAYAKVALNVVDVRTSEIVYAAQGAGEYALSDREVIGFGGASGYDATLNGKVLNLAITQAVNALVLGLEQGDWHPSASN